MAVWKVCHFFHICEQFKQSTGCIFPTALLSLSICSATENTIFCLFVSPPCAAGSIHSWLFRQREINQVAPCGPPTNLESLEKIKICATKLKNLIWFASEYTVNQREEMWSWCKILLGSAVLYQSKLSSLMLMLWPSAHQSFKKSLNPLHYKPLIHSVYMTV